MSDEVVTACPWCTAEHTGGEGVVSCLTALAARVNELENALLDLQLDAEVDR